MTGSPIWHPFTQHGLNEPIPLVTHAVGAVLHTADGRRIVDGISSWWVTTHGHCHPRIMAAIAEQTTKLDQITYMDVLQRDLRVMDHTATTLCMENRLPIVVFDLMKPGNVRSLLDGQAIGTLVC